MTWKPETGEYHTLASRCLIETNMGACLVVLLGVKGNLIGGDFGVSIADPRVASAFATMLRATAGGFEKLNRMAKKRKVKRRKHGR